MTGLLFNLIWICISRSISVPDGHISPSAGQSEPAAINWWTANTTGVVLSQDGKYALSGCISSTPIGLIEPDRYYGLISGFWGSECNFTLPPRREPVRLLQSSPSFELYQNSPNPFRKTTKIAYCLPVKSRVSLAIYDNCGRKVRVLINGWQNAGRYTINWNGKDDRGRKCPAGIYFYLIKTETNKDIKKMVIAK